MVKTAKILKQIVDTADRAAALEHALRRLHDAFTPGMVITIAGNPIDHSELNEAKLQAAALLQ